MRHPAGTAAWVVDHEVGPRGVTVWNVNDGIASFTYNLPLPGREYPLFAAQDAYRAAQEERHSLPADQIFYDRESARRRAIALGRSQR